MKQKVFRSFLFLPIVFCGLVFHGNTGADEGTRKWTFETSGSVVSSPTIAPDGTIYVGSNDGSLYAVDPAGSLKWIFLTKGAVHSRPAIGPDGTIYFGSWDQHLYAIRPDGRLKWKFPTKGRISSSPIVGPDGTIYVGSWDHNLYALGPHGNLKWSVPTGKEIFSSPAIGPDGTVYVGSWDRNLYAINGHSRRPPGPGETSPDEKKRVVPPASPPGRITLGVSRALVRERPFFGAGIKFELKEGDAVSIVEIVDGWYFVETEDGRRGWAHQSLFSESRETQADGSGGLKEVRDIRFEMTSEGAERVVVTLRSDGPPKFFAIKGGRTRLVCDFVGAGLRRNVDRRIEVDGRIIKGIRTAVHRSPKPRVRIVMDLAPDQDPVIEQEFLRQKNLYVLTVRPTGEKQPLSR